MIYLDNLGYPTDQTKDEGDSAVRASILSMCNDTKSFHLSDYEIEPGLLVRHPKHPVWSSEDNCSRDQMIMLIAGFDAVKRKDIVRRVFYKSLKRCFFAQNFERDKFGSKKYPWPHTFINDQGLEEKRLFDFADPLFPNHIGAMIIAGEMWYLYWLMPIALFFHYLFLYFSKHNDFEKNQTIAESYIYGTLRTFRKWDPDWYIVNANYWHRRNESEYQEMLQKLVDKR